MGRPYSKRRRRRPGRRPPYRYRAAHSPSASEARPQGYSSTALRRLYDLVLPFRGPAKRLFFNALSTLTVVATGLAAGTVGYGIGGPLGGLIGIGVGVSAGGRYLERNRFFRE